MPISVSDIKINFFLIFDWWWRHHKTLFQRFAFHSGSPEDALLIDIGEADGSAISMSTVFGPSLSNANCRFVVRRKGQERFFSPLNLPAEVSAHNQTRLPVGVRLPSSMVLRYDLTLPMAAEAYLETAISFEIDRLKPFSVDDVFWSFQTLRKDVGNLKIALLIVPRKSISGLLSRLTEMGISASFIESGGLNIQISRERTPLYLNQSKLIVFCCFLTLLLLAIPVLNQEYLLIKTNNEIQKRRPLEQKALALRSYEDNVAKVQDIIARSRKTNDMLAVLGKITVALPEGTSLTQLVTNDTIVTISGESTDAAGLITRLEKVAGFYSPRFAGSITETAPDNDDIFTIEFSTTPGALIEP